MKLTDRFKIKPFLESIFVKIILHRSETASLDYLAALLKRLLLVCINARMQLKFITDCTE